MQGVYQSFLCSTDLGQSKMVDRMNSHLSKLVALQHRKESLESKISDLRRAAANAAKRDDARRKILVGAAVIAAIESGKTPPAPFIALLDRFLTRPGDRAVFKTGPIALTPAPQQMVPPTPSSSE
jgi:hypothetical protein